MTTITVTTTASLTKDAQKQAVLAGTPRAQQETVTFQIPAKYIDSCTIYRDGGVILPERRIYSIHSSGLLYLVNDIAELEDGALYMARWEEANAKEAIENTKYLKNFAIKIEETEPQLLAFIAEHERKADSPGLINLADIAKQEWMQNETLCKERNTYSNILVCFLENGHLPAHLENYLEPVKNEEWFTPLIARLTTLHEAFQKDRNARVQQMKEINAKKEMLIAQAKRAAEEKQQAQLQSMIDWAKEHGSERVKLMFELEAGDAIKVAEIEFVDAHCPEGFSREAYQIYSTGGERKRPTLQELHALKQLRALKAAQPDLYFDEELVWGTYGSDHHSFVYKQALLQVKVQAPSGGCHYIAMPFPDTRVEQQ